MKTVETVRSPRRAATLLAHPLRATILRTAREPISASDIARVLREPRQRVHYHVRLLARAGFLEPAAQHKKRNMVEQQYVASARAYVLTPEVLGEAAPSPPTDVVDAASAEQLVALCARAQTEVATVMEAADEAGVRVRTLSMQSDIRFETAEQRAEFTQALLAAINDVVARHASPFTNDTGDAAPGRPFRLLLACYPKPQTDRTTFQNSEFRPIHP
jgi:hypothetical protein